ncbi:hypothetical protein RDWZM_003203 [Blomia tropicalis]|uniref:1-phosphatidylinositol-3-phosphate 5-kinase n=1 Tax=Blomia tropicalis TaxID=40697 RepID=A0A9Q0MEG1_BLOTA|nr:hypothetical protein RDWZM_003203 [Blomia tropicalis]
MQSPDKSVKSSKGDSGLFGSVRKKVQQMQINNQTDSGRQFWMPDSRAKQCYDCNSSFNAFRRRHHCRLCGQVFCHWCSPHMIDAKLYKSCTGIETNGSVRVCKYCYRVTLRNEMQDGGSDGQAIQTKEVITTKPGTTNTSTTTTSTAIISSGVINNWLNKLPLGRRLSSSASLVSINEMNHTTNNNQDKRTKLSRPLSVASNECDRRFSVDNNQLSASGYDIVCSSSYDNLRTVMNEVDDRMNESKPNWVREILEESKLRQISNEESGDDILNENYIYYSSDDDEKGSFDTILDRSNEMSLSEIDSHSNVKLNFISGETTVRYRSSNSQRKEKMRTSNTKDLKNDDSIGSLESNSAAKEMFNHLLPEDKSYFDEIFISNRQDQVTGNDVSQSIIQNQQHTRDDVASSLIETIYEKHSYRILQQTLIDEKLSLDWLPVLNDLSRRIANTITLSHHSYLSSLDNYYMDNIETRQGLRRDTVTTIKCGNTFYPMDIRQRIKVKAIPNGSKSDCKIVNGVVFSKNVSNRKMASSIDNARILLFACSIGYDERKRSLATTTSTSAILKLTSFDSMRLQEHNYLSNLVAKIASMKPDVIFVQGSVSHTALELLFYEHKINVVLNVKRSILERISLTTGTQLIHSPEILNSTRIGMCGKFYLQEFIISKEIDSTKDARLSFAKKTLMFVEGCSQSTSCSVLLRGCSRYSEFRQLKSILGYMVHVHYNNRLEKAFHFGLSCMPIESDNWTSMNELVQHVNRVRQRISSSRSISSKNLDEVAPTIMVVAEDSKPNDLNKLLKAELTTISDNSDPLRSVEAEDKVNGNFQLNNIQLAKVVSSKFEQLSLTTPLSSSPSIDYPIPFIMEDDAHSKSSLRHYYPPNLIISERLSALALAEISNIGGIANEIYHHREYFENDEDYANFSYLSSLYSEIKNDYPFLADAVNRKAECKLASLKKLLTARYMVSKPHPLLNSNDSDLINNGKQHVADFRACGSYLRCVPDITSRKVAPKNKQNSKTTLNRQFLSQMLNFSSDATLSCSDNDRLMEPFSTIDQESISVLFSVFSPHSKNAPNYCFKPRILDISYYGRNDMSIGAFLFRHFFFLRSRFNQPMHVGRNESNHMPPLNPNGTFNRKLFCSSEACTASMFRHLVRFSHHRGTITILLSKIHDSRNVSMPHKVLTWTFCMRCRQKSNNVEMSPDALALSFGKFLELKFYGNRHFNYNRYFPDMNENGSSMCTHSLHKEGYQFFSYDQLVVSFKYDPIVLYEIVPPLPITCITRNQFSKSGLISYLHDLTVKGHDLFVKIGEEIDKFNELFQNRLNPNVASSFSLITCEANDSNVLAEWTQKLNNEKAEFEQTIKEVQIQISTSEFEAVSVFNLFRTQNKAIGIKKMIVEIVFSWNDRINEFVSARKRNPDKLLSSIMSRILPSDQTAKLDSLKNSDTISNKSFDLDKNEKTVDFTQSTEECNTGTNPDTPEDELNQLSKVPPNKLTKITNKVMTKVATKVTEMGDNPTVPSTSFARFLNRGTDENYISLIESDSMKQSVVSDLNQQIEVQFNDSTAKFYCCIYFAEQFRRLRSMVLVDGAHSNRETARQILSLSLTEDNHHNNNAEDFYIHSLSCCIPWNAIGGKSGSAFSKTLNQRFILKEISKGEFNHFLTFACDYVNYCEQALLQKNPSSLVKIVGVYQISYKNTSKASVHHILVMENLFYECNISFIYDLKGSMRNRKVEIVTNNLQTEGESQPNENETNQTIEDSWRNVHDEAKLFQSNHNQTTTVLMDENLRQISTCYPLYVHEHSKKLLMEAIFRDSEFLCVHGVMDYSLLVGFDEQFSEYVVGIIDYVRLFNWEKEIEFRVKKLGKAIDPTIVHPSQYQRRFLDAINDYFIEVPDKWHSFMQLAPLANRSNVDTVWEGKNNKLINDTSSCNLTNEYDNVQDKNL